MALTKVTEGVRTLGTGEVATANMATDPTNASNLSSGDVPLAQLGNVDNSAVLNDIATLALHSAVQNNQAAYNLSNAFIDQFEDDSGIDAETNTDRTGDEYVASVYPEPNTLLLLHMDGDNAGTVFTDGVGRHTVTAYGNANTSTAQKKFGTASLYCDGTGDYLSMPDSADWVIGSSEDFTIEFWVRIASASTRTVFEQFIDNNNVHFFYHNSVLDLRSYFYDSGVDNMAFVTSLNPTVDNWSHIAVVRNGSAQVLYLDGVSAATSTYSGAYGDLAAPFTIGQDQQSVVGSNDYYGYLDEFRWSNTARYTSAFTPPVAAFADNIANATGNFTSTTETSSGTVSSMGIVVLYKNAYGTATLDTDLIAQVSADGGANYTSAPLTAAGTFSTGINIAVANAVSISNTGTAPKYKISFANQVLASKETQVHGVALLY